MAYATWTAATSGRDTCKAYSGSATSHLKPIKRSPRSATGRRVANNPASGVSRRATGCSAGEPLAADDEVEVSDDAAVALCVSCFAGAIVIRTAEIGDCLVSKSRKLLHHSMLELHATNCAIRSHVEIKHSEGLC